MIQVVEFSSGVKMRLPLHPVFASICKRSVKSNLEFASDTK